MNKERDDLQARVAAAERTISIYAKDVTSLRQECDRAIAERDEARRSAETLATAARNFRDDATGSLESQNRLWDALDGFDGRTPPVGELIERHITAAHRESLAVIDNLQKLVVNTRYRIAHGCSETATKALDEAMADGWAATSGGGR